MVKVAESKTVCVPLASGEKLFDGRESFLRDPPGADGASTEGEGRGPLETIGDVERGGRPLSQLEKAASRRAIFASSRERAQLSILDEAEAASCALQREGREEGESKKVNVKKSRCQLRLFRKRRKDAQLSTLLCRELVSGLRVGEAECSDGDFQRVRVAKVG